MRPNHAPGRVFVARAATVPKPQQPRLAHTLHQPGRSISLAQKPDRFAHFAACKQSGVVPARGGRVEGRIVWALAVAARAQRGGCGRLGRRAGGGDALSPGKGERRAARGCGGPHLVFRKGKKPTLKVRNHDHEKKKSIKPSTSSLSLNTTYVFLNHQLLGRISRTTSPRARHAASVSSDWVRKASTPVNPAL